MRKAAVIMSIALVALAASKAMAARCAGWPNPVFCDDFDCWCGDAPVPGATCTACDSSTTSPNMTAFREFWPADGECTGINAMHGLTGPGSWKYPTGWMATVAQANNPPPVRIYRHTHDMSVQIMAHSLNPNHYGAINGAGPISDPLTTSNTIPPDYVDSMRQRPDALKGQFFMQLSSNPGAYAQMIYYTELYLNDDRAPTNFTRVACSGVNDCYCLDGFCDPGEQTVCMGGPRLGMPCTEDIECDGGVRRPVLARTDGQVHASFAIGVMGPMDTNPCDADKSWTSRLVVYDGLNWKELGKANFASIPSASGPAGQSCAEAGKLNCADLHPEVNFNIVYFSIGETDVEIRLYNSRANTFGSQGFLPDHDPDPTKTSYYFVAKVPRQYLGAFNRIALGPGKGTELNSPTCYNYGGTTTPEWYRCDYGARAGQECDPAALPTDPLGCPPSTTEECLESWAANSMAVDEVVLFGGMFQEANLGACCKPDLLGDEPCVQTTQQGCADIGGTFRGENSTCATTLCCNDPFADMDGDKDVDQADFSVFQACVTASGNTAAGVCRCLDRAPTGGNNAIDQDDYSLFELCASGAGITANILCDGAP